MGLQRLPASIDIRSAPFGNYGSVLMNAANESCSGIGQLVTSDGNGSKVLSAAGGGSIWFEISSAPTFANAGTTLRVGIQDVDYTTGRGDGTFDVYKDLVGGTDTLNFWTRAYMGSGTKTMSPGDIFVFKIEMTSRGGTDSVSVKRQSLDGNVGGFPYGSSNTGTEIRHGHLPSVFIVFDDGTYGWFHATAPLGLNANSFAYGNYDSTSTPDEFAAVFSVPIEVTITEVGLGVNSVGPGDEMEVVIYSDPEGTPTVIETIPHDSDLIYSPGWVRRMCSPLTLTPNVLYAVSLRPTTAGPIQPLHKDMTASYASGPHNELKTSWFFPTLKIGTRTNQTGAFTAAAEYYVPVFMVGVSHIHDGLGGSSAFRQSVHVGSAVGRASSY